MQEGCGGTLRQLPIDRFDSSDSSYISSHRFTVDPPLLPEIQHRCKGGEFQVRIESNPLPLSPPPPPPPSPTPPYWLIEIFTSELRQPPIGY